MREKIEACRRFFEREHPASFELLPGPGPVMISAPHSVGQIREGRPKAAEPGTGLLALLLHGDGCPVIVKTRNLGDDANFDPVSPYREALCRYVRGHGVRFLLDLHQLSPGRAEMIDIGTGRFVNGSRREADLLVRRLSRPLFQPLSVDGLFSGGGPNTVCSQTARDCRIPCLQLELNSRLFPGPKEAPGPAFFALWEALRGAVSDLAALP